MTTTNAAPHPQRAPALEEHAADPRVERIVFATDGGDAGNGAKAWVERRAKMHRLNVAVVTVVERDWMTAELMGEEFNEAAGRVVEEVERHFASAAPSIEVTTEVRWGDARESIASASESADLLVVGTNRVGRAAALLGGSFPTKLVEGARCPVVVVPKNWKPGHGAVVVGFQGDGSDATALAFAAHEASVLHRELRVVHAWRTPTILGPDIAFTGDEIDVSVPHDSVLRRGVTELRGRYPDLTVRGVLANGEPSEVLTQEADGEEMLVVGSHGWSVTDRFFIGSISREVLTRVVCPVAVLRPQGKTE